jgi:hypothetical protein
MVGGTFGVFLWGLVLGAGLVGVTLGLSIGSSPRSLALAAFGMQWIYFAVRAGLGASALLYVVLVCAGISVWYAVASVVSRGLVQPAHLGIQSKNREASLR